MHLDKEKIFLLGSGRFASEVFRYLIEKGLPIAGVFTYPPKESGRKHTLKEDSVAEMALELGIELFRFDSYTKDSDAQNKLTELKPDLGIVLSFRILPEEIYSIPKNGMINLHPSLLPALRGAAPLNWAIAKGYTKSGFTTFLLDKKVDAGNIILQSNWNIEADENVFDLTKKLVIPAAEHLFKTIPLILDKSFVPKAQDESKKSNAPKIKRKHLRIDWRRSAKEIHNQTRGFYPVAYAVYNGKDIAIVDSEISDDSGDIGEILGIEGNGIKIACSEGAIIAKILKPQGKGKMEGKAFYNGYIKDKTLFFQ